MYGLVKCGNFAWNAYKVAQADRGEGEDGTPRTTLYMEHPEDEPINFYGEEANAAWEWVVRNAEDITPQRADIAVTERPVCVQ